MSLKSASSMAGHLRNYVGVCFVRQGRIEELFRLLNEIAMGSDYTVDDFGKLAQFGSVVESAELSPEGQRISEDTFGHAPRAMLYLSIRGLRVEAAQPE